jgi:hypothetical protein
MASKYDTLDKLYKAVDAYCTASKEAKGPIPEHYWHSVELAWKAAKKIIEPGKVESA